MVDYAWDNSKAQTNLRKHNIDFADAVGVLEDDQALTLADDDPDEDRFIMIGAASHITRTKTVRR
jgi:uncharacterized protein